MTVHLVVWCVLSFFAGVVAGVVLIGLCLAAREAETGQRLAPQQPPLHVVHAPSDRHPSTS